MNTNAMIETVCNEIKQNLTAFCEQENFKALTPEGAEPMSEGMGHALAARGVAGFRAFLLGLRAHIKSGRWDVFWEAYNQLATTA